MTSKPGALRLIDLPRLNLAALFLFIGAMGKSAQIPLYVWLPDAMAGPTPVSALIHAATMVTAGVYMMARLNFLYRHVPRRDAFVAVDRARDRVLRGARSRSSQNDIKKVLAYSTVSQLGYMFLALGIGRVSSPASSTSSRTRSSRRCLFLGAGSVIHGLHDEQDIRKMGGLRKVDAVTRSGRSSSRRSRSAGLPPFSGFFSKDAHALQRPARRAPRGWHASGRLGACRVAAHRVLHDASLRSCIFWASTAAPRRAPAREPAGDDGSARRPRRGPPRGLPRDAG